MMLDRRLRAAPLILAALVAFAACTGSASPSGLSSASPTATPTPAGSAPSTPGGTIDPGQPSADPTAGPSAEPEPLLTQSWATATLTEVETGETFRIADLATSGRTVFVEAMAIWCSNCRRQMYEFVAAIPNLDPATVDYVALTTEPSEKAGQLADYKRQQGFLGRFAVAGPEVSAALAADFGSTILIPPSVPKLVIRNGQVEFMTGHHSAAEIVALAGG